jgi:hypothetical protein
VVFSSLEDARRVVFSELAGVLPARDQARLAGVVAARLRDAGLLGSCIEQHYSAAQVAALLGRSPAWAVKRAKAGEFGPVVWDDGLLISASGFHGYLSARIVGSSLPKNCATGEMRRESVLQKDWTGPQAPQVESLESAGRTDA